MANLIQKLDAVGAPRAIGPYSQAVSVAGGHQLIYVSGQLPMDPATGELVSGDIQTLTNRVLDNIEAILIAGGSSLQHVVRSDIFLTDLKRDFAGMNEAYAKRFTSEIPPARQTVQVSGLPKEASIEISCIAVVMGKL